MKRSLIISNKHGIYELPNNLGLRILGKCKKSKKSQDFTELQLNTQSSSKNKNFVDTSKTDEI